MVALDKEHSNKIEKNRTKRLLVSGHHKGKQTSLHAFVSAAWQQGSIIDEKPGRCVHWLIIWLPCKTIHAVTVKGSESTRSVSGCWHCWRYDRKLAKAQRGETDMCKFCNSYIIPVGGRRNADQRRSAILNVFNIPACSSTHCDKTDNLIHRLSNDVSYLTQVGKIMVKPV